MIIQGIFHINQMQTHKHKDYFSFSSSFPHSNHQHVSKKKIEIEMPYSGGKRLGNDEA